MATKILTGPEADQFQIAARDLIKAHLNANMSETNMHRLMLNTMNQVLIDELLAFSGMNQSQTAKVAGLNRATLRKIIKDLDLI